MWRPSKRCGVVIKSLVLFIGSEVRCGLCHPCSPKAYAESHRNQECLQELISPSPEEYRRAQMDELQRIKLSLSMLAAGADRIHDLYHVPQTEVIAKGGPATNLSRALKALPEAADEEEQRHRGRQAVRGDTFEVRLRYV